MPITSLIKTALDAPDEDVVRIKGASVDLHINILSGKQGDFFVLYAPALNVSGYGAIETEAEDFLKLEIETFCEDLLGMSSKERESFLYSLGFSRKAFHSKNFSKAYVDEEGKLQDFEEGTLERRIFETAAA